MSPKKSRSKKATKTALPDGLFPSALCNPCDPGSLKFETTDELPDLEFVIGQPRAIRALELGSEVTGQGYNTFVLGRPGSGRTTLSQEYLARKAKNESTPGDWCYVNNFENQRCPIALKLPAGRAVELRKDIDVLVTQCERGISQQFESKEFVAERDRLVNHLKKNQEAEFIRLQQYVEKFSFVIVRTPFGFILVPAEDGKPLKPEDIEKLTPELRTKFNQVQEKLGKELEKSLKRLRDMEKATSEQLDELNTRAILFLLEPLMQALETKYIGYEGVLQHLENIKADIIANANQFRSEEGNSHTDLGAQIAQHGWQRRYEINVLVDNSHLDGAPVIVESHPSYINLIGRIEHEVVLGATKTDFTMIQPGALHKANGGYLVIPARDLLINNYAWEGLKRVLRDGEIRIIELGYQIGLMSSVTLEPKPVPLNIKVILVGTPLLYYLLRSNDEDFSKLFKVRAEFATTMERNPETEYEYGLFVNSVVKDNQLPPFDRTAVARIIEYSSRLAEDQNKLSTRFGKIADLVREAAYWNKKNISPEQDEPSKADDLVVTARDVQRAIHESIYRSNLFEERIQGLITEGTLLIDVSGEAIGQINALSIIRMGDYSFGHPSRVTATAYPGKGGVTNIERQADLSGKLHTKGILILNGLMGERYGRGKPLSLSANLTFEQSYDEVEGDSASAAELFSILSAIAEIPLRQDRAITGSINQHGDIQAIGGVNKKIEGFFAICKAKGFNGNQGVIIPASNEKHLMLNEDVIEAVKNDQFHIWSINSVEEGIKLLSGYEPGERQADDSYPEGTFNHAVISRLERFSKAKSEAPDEKPQQEEERESQGEPEGNNP